MSISPAACGELSPDDCAVIRTRLLSKHLSSEKLLQRPVELADDKKKTPCFCVLEQGVFVFSPTPVFRIQTRVLRMSHESDRLAPQGAFLASFGCFF